MYKPVYIYTTRPNSVFHIFEDLHANLWKYDAYKIRSVVSPLIYMTQTDRTTTTYATSRYFGPVNYKYTHTDNNRKRAFVSLPDHRHARFRPIFAIILAAMVTTTVELVVGSSGHIVFSSPEGGLRCRSLPHHALRRPRSCHWPMVMSTGRKVLLVIRLRVRCSFDPPVSGI
jgi:hypothetical protein